MHRKTDFHSVKSIAVVLVGAIGLGITNLGAAPSERFDARVILSVYDLANHYEKNNHRSYLLAVHIDYTVPNPLKKPAGALAAFGAFDSGEVKLMYHVKYIPNLTDTYSDRHFEAPGQGLQISDQPRYIMVCAWSNSTPAEPIFKLYTERNDSAASNNTVSHLGASWKTISSRRAKDKFTEHDYCDELSKGQKSSAPLWFPGAED